MATLGGLHCTHAGLRSQADAGSCMLAVASPPQGRVFDIPKPLHNRPMVMQVDDVRYTSLQLMTDHPHFWSFWQASHPAFRAHSLHITVASCQQGITLRMSSLHDTKLHVMSCMIQTCLCEAVC